MSDPFGTAQLRRRVLDAWAASPDRFREDANAEEDLALGGYRDRLLVELAQNAADAAARAGVAGKLRLRLAEGELRAANTGAPLDAAGAAALASLRASSKRDSPGIGRFGVGFAAVLSVTDEPAVVSREGGVRFSAARTREAVTALPSLTEELARRRGAVPVLRLPWAEAGQPPAGFDTEVRLPLRPGTAELVRRALDDFDSALLLALPQLSQVDLDGRVLTRTDDGADVVISDDGSQHRWRVMNHAGELPTELLADRPTEERERRGWSVTVAAPAGNPLQERQRVHAPTPSDEPLSLPVRLIASFPLNPDRRHVAPGSLTDWLVQRVAEAYAELVAGLATGPEVLALVPRIGLAAAELDAKIGAAVLARLRAAPWLPRGAAVLEPDISAAYEPLAELVAGLLPVEWSARRHQRALDALGVRRLDTADVVDLVTAAEREPGWWRELYAALAGSQDRDALGALPVPLVDGRVVTGPRGLLLPGAELPATAALTTALGLRIVHPDAVHPLLERLGARPATARGVLEDERIRALVEGSYDSDDDPEPLAEAVLTLVAAAGIRPGELPWLAELALPGEDGESYPAGELLLPGSSLAEVAAADAPFGRLPPALLERWGHEALRAVGVLETFAVLRVPDADLGTEPAYDLDGEEDWAREVTAGVPAVAEELVAVRDLELVAPDSWPAALRLLAAEPLRSAVLADPLLHPVDEPARTVTSYTRWWLARHPVLDGRCPRELRLASATELAGLYDRARPGDEEWLALIGCRRDLADVLADTAGALDLLDRLADPGRECPAATLRIAYARLAELLDPADVPPPARVRVGPRSVIPASSAVVLDAPYLLPLLGKLVPVPGGEAVADLLDLPLASERVSGQVTSSPSFELHWEVIRGVALAAERLGAPVPEGKVAVHQALLVDGERVDWWPGGADGPDAVDESAGPGALGRALAWRLHRWDGRAAAAEAFTHPDQEERLRAEDGC